MSFRKVRRLCALILVILPTRAVAAQRVLTTFDVGATRMQYADSLHVNAMSFSPALSTDWDRVRLRGTGTFAKLATEGWSTQGVLSGSLFSAQHGPLVGEVAGTAGGSAHWDGARTGQAIAAARGYLNAAGAGAWLGGGAGRTWDGLQWRTVQQGDVGAWVQHGNATLSGSVVPAAVDDTLRYMDSQLALRWESRRLDIDLSAGTRAGKRLLPTGGTTRTWGGATLTLWVDTQMGIVASAGSYPVDLTQGFPGGRYASLALRLSSPRALVVSAAPGAETRDASSDTPVHAFVIERSANGHSAIRLTAGSAAKVEIMGDFTNWQPVALARGTTGVWSVLLPISAGTHQINLRVNDGPWLVPPGLLTIADEFGGAAGLLTVR